MIKKLISTINPSNVAPIGQQYPAAMTKEGEELVTKYTANGQVAVLPHTKEGAATISFTDASTFFVENKEGQPNADDGSGTQANVVKTLLNRKSLPYSMTMGTIWLAPLGVSSRDLANNNGTFDTKLMSHELDYYAKPSLTSTGSTAISAWINTLDNLNIKVQNAFNRPLPFNNATREERFAMMYNYHLDLLQVVHIFNRLSGLVSYAYKMSDNHVLDTSNAIALYDPTLFSKLDTVYKKFKGFPIMDTLTFSMCQRLTKFYAANELNYFPGAYHQFSLRLPIGNKAGTISGNNGQFSVKTKLDDLYHQTQGIDTAVSSNTLISLVDSLFELASNITGTYNTTIQFLIQADAKGLYAMHQIAEFVDFSDEGLNVYDIEKDYQINNFIKNLPLPFNVEVGSATKVFVLSPQVIPFVNTTSESVFDSMVRYVSPYCMKNDIFMTDELLAIGVWEIDTASSGDNNTSFIIAKDAVTGMEYRYDSRELSFECPTVWYVSGSTVKIPLQNTCEYNIKTAPKLEGQVCITGLINATTTAVVYVTGILQQIVDQFDLYYMTCSMNAVAGSKDQCILVTDLEADSYFMKLPISLLENANSDFFTSVADKVAWLEGKVATNLYKPKNQEGAK